MSERQEYLPPVSEGFSLTEHEQLFSRLSDRRLRELLFTPDTTVHSIELSSNNYGEFLFITASRPKGRGREVLTFWGLGYHEDRERWLTQEWFWYRSDPYRNSAASLSGSEAELILETRVEEVKHYANTSPQSHRGKLFELLADLTDEDGAKTELDDLGNLWE